MRAEAIRDTANPATTANDLPATPAQEYVHAATGEPSALVEAILRAARRGHGRSECEDGSLRRRPAEWQLEQDSLAKGTLAKALDLSRDAEREG